MRHRIKTKKLSRFSSYYEATMKSLTQALLIHQRIITTKLRAKLVRQSVERLISLGKQKDSLAARRRAFSVLNNHGLVKKLFSDIAPMFINRNGGYTRIIAYKRRRGDNAQMVILELSMRKVEPTKKPTKEEKQAKIQEKKIIRQELQRKEAQPKPAAKSKEVAPPEKERHKKDIKKPTKKIIGGLGKIFKPERDSL